MQRSIWRELLLHWDNSTRLVFLYRAWQAGAGLCTLVLVFHLLSPIEQGFYYTYASIAAMQVFLDAGLSAALIQVSAHAFSRMNWSSDRQIEGKDQSIFYALIRKSALWYLTASLIFLSIAAPAGIMFLSSNAFLAPPHWQWNWVFLVVATALSLVMVPFMSILEGSGLVSEVYGIRLLQAVSGSLATWWLLWKGYGLLAVCATPLMTFIISATALGLRHRFTLINMWKVKTGSFNWKENVWPFQWRIGLSWLSGYVLVQMHTPLLFRLKGPVEAGQMGLSVTIISMLSLLAMIGITSRTPSLARLASKKNWTEMDNLFFSAAKISLILYGLGAFLLLSLCYSLENTMYAHRIISFTDMFILCLAFLSSHIVGLLAVYLRAHKAEPYVGLSVAGALLALIGVLAVTPSFGVRGIACVLLVVHGAIGIPIALKIWSTYRENWHK